MNKKQLLERIWSLPDDTLFLVSSDEEGNNFDTLEEVSVGYAYKDGHEWYTVHPDDVQEYLDDGEELLTVAVLWP